jgi:hypothetical protein
MAPHEPHEFTVRFASSQPLVRSPSQFTNPVSHIVKLHAGGISEQLSPVACAVRTLQSTKAPHVPHVDGDVVLTSQPFMALPSQSEVPLGHAVTWQLPRTQVGTPEGALQTVGHVPQWLGSRMRSASQPSATRPLQSPKPTSHDDAVSTQAALEHVAAFTLGSALQSIPHEPQCAAVSDSDTSHPFASRRSQSSNPASQRVSWHALPTQDSSAFASAQGVSQSPQCATDVERSVSHPGLASQSPKLAST